MGAKNGVFFKCFLRFTVLFTVEHAWVACVLHDCWGVLVDKIGSAVRCWSLEPIISFQAGVVAIVHEEPIERKGPNPDPPAKTQKLLAWEQHRTKAIYIYIYTYGGLCAAVRPGDAAHGRRRGAPRGAPG